MFENFKKITIQGGYFEQPVALKLFNDKQYLSIIYGRNGSGKTTIAKAMRQLVGKDTEYPTDEGYISYSVSTDVAISDDKKASVFIFDEEFVRENVRMKRNGLETIVMMGEQVALDTQITLKNAEKLALEKKIAELTIQKEKFEDKINTSSPLYFFNKIREKLREDGGWADIDRMVKRNSVKSHVTEDLVRRFVSMEESKETEDDIRQMLQANLALYAQSEDAQIITWIPLTLTCPANLDEITDLIQKRIERPELSEREQKLLTFLEEHTEHHLQETTLQLTSEKWPFCPLCLRDTGNDDYATISETLKRILNKESELYRATLDQAMGEFAQVEVTLPILPPLNDTEKRRAQLAIEQLNKDLDIIRDRIDQRKRDIYGVVTEAFNTDMISNYHAHLAEFKEAMKTLEVCVATFNQSVNEREKLKKLIMHENEQLTKKRLKVLFDGYNRATKAYGKCKDGLTQLEKDKERTENEIKELKAQAGRTDIALEYINKQLQYVFYSTTKARLAAGEGCYKLRINGRNVPPKKISVGERNVLGLCYFFAKLFSNKRAENKYADELLIVIDDPVSSFDSGNRLGVMSLLRHQFCSIQKGNANSRVLVLTHDLRSAFDLVKIYSELNNGKGGQKKFFELSNKKISERDVSNEYKRLLESVYNYAMGRTNEDDEYIEGSIGNVMRRLVEAFASFCYNKSFEEMMCHEGVLKSIPSEKRMYYENFMCRLALNGESHMEERVYGLDTITPYFTKQEKMQTAKSLLLFLSYINEEHLSCYLAPSKNDNEDKISEIKKMREEEEAWLK